MKEKKETPVAVSGKLCTQIHLQIWLSVLQVWQQMDLPKSTHACESSLLAEARCATSRISNVHQTSTCQVDHCSTDENNAQRPTLFSFAGAPTTVSGAPTTVSGAPVKESPKLPVKKDPFLGLKTKLGSLIKKPELPKVPELPALPELPTAVSGNAHPRHCIAMSGQCYAWAHRNGG